MNLSSVFSKWRTYTPRIFGNDKEDEPFTVQYKLVAKGEVDRIDNLSEEQVEKEVRKWPAIQQHLADEWDKFSLTTKREMLLSASHIGRVDSLTDGDKALTDIMQVFAALNGVQGGRLMRELTGCIIGVNQEDKKNFGQ